MFFPDRARREKFKECTQGRRNGFLQRGDDSDLLVHGPYPHCSLHDFSAWTSGHGSLFSPEICCSCRGDAIAVACRSIGPQLLRRRGGDAIAAAAGWPADAVGMPSHLQAAVWMPSDDGSLEVVSQIQKALCHPSASASGVSYIVARCINNQGQRTYTECL